MVPDKSEFAERAHKLAESAQSLEFCKFEINILNDAH
jgi:hypothetical protein